MTTADLKSYFTGILSSENLDFPDTGEHIDRAVKIGLKDFWGAHDWSFRSADVELSITAIEQEAYDLPDNFAAFRSIREKTSSEGTDLLYKTKEDFDMLIPRPDSVSSGTPDWFTVFRDAENNKWKISFYPRPDAAMTIYMNILLTAPTKPDGIPEDFVSGVLAFVAKYIYPYSHAGRLDAVREAMIELERLRRIDKTDKSHVTFMLDNTREQSSFKYEWL